MLPRHDIVHCVEQALQAAPTGLELILMGDLNVRLGDPCEKQEEDLATALADQGLVNMTGNLLPRRQYWGAGGWKWSMQRDERKLTGRGDYILSMERRSFVNTGLREKHHGTDHMLILAVLQGEGALRNRCYQQKRTRWKIRLKGIRPQTEGEAAFAVFKGEIPRTPRPTKARESWISQETRKLVDRRAKLHSPWKGAVFSTQGYGRNTTAHTTC